MVIPENFPKSFPSWKAMFYYLAHGVHCISTLYRVGWRLRANVDLNCNYRERSVEYVEATDQSCENSLFEIPSIRSEDFSATSDHSTSSFVQIEDTFSRSVSVVSESSSTRSSLFDSAFIAEESFVSKPNVDDKIKKAESIDHLDVLQRIENRIEHFRNKFHLSSAHESNKEYDSSNTRNQKQVSVTVLNLSHSTNFLSVLKVFLSDAIFLGKVSE